MTSIALTVGQLPARLPIFLRDLGAVAVALLTRDGVLNDANPSFLRLIPGESGATELLDVRHLFVNPRFDQFAARRGESSDGSVYRGIFNIGDINRQVKSLRGAIYESGNNLLLVAEHDVEQLEKNVAMLHMLNEELATAGREIARLERKLDRNEDAAQGALADREALLDVLFQNSRGSHPVDLSTGYGFSDEAADCFGARSTETLGTGITDLDDEHRDLISRFDRVASSVTLEGNVSAFRSQFETLMDATARHFAHEERVMKTIGFPSRLQHKKEHDRLLRDSQDFLENIGTALPADDCPAIAHYLKHWLVRHMRESHSEIRAFINR